MAEPVWQELLRLRLADRNAKESAFAPVIEQCTRTLSFSCLFPFIIIDCIPIPQDRRLAQQTKLLKERNASLLRAVATVKQNPSSSTVFVPGTGDEWVLIDVLLPPRITYAPPAETPSGRPILLLSRDRY